MLPVALSCWPCLSRHPCAAQGVVCGHPCTSKQQCSTAAALHAPDHPQHGLSGGGGGGCSSQQWGTAPVTDCLQGEGGGAKGLVCCQQQNTRSACVWEPDVAVSDEQQLSFQSRCPPLGVANARVCAVVLLQSTTPDTSSVPPSCHPPHQTPSRRPSCVPAWRLPAYTTAT
jgi:hypothetical protein